MMLAATFAGFNQKKANELTNKATSKNISWEYDIFERA